jgi:hypothetical protein
MTNPTGGIDYSDDPILPAWYVPGWTSQNQETSQFSLPAPANRINAFGSLPANLSYTEVTGIYSDGNNNQLGGYLTFEQSNDLVISVDGQAYRVPKRLVGDIPVANLLAWNAEGSGKVYLQFGKLDVIVLANDNIDVTIMAESPTKTPPAQWVYHVKEYFMRGYEYDIFVPSSTVAQDINSLVIPGTQKLNPDWHRGY